jgi:acetyl-CoA carboxylase biotin carboxyl carrier protein
MSDKPSDPFDVEAVRRLAAVLEDTGLSEIEVERGDLRIRVARTLSVTVAAPAAAPIAVAAAAPAAAVGAPTYVTSTESLPAGEVVTSPMVGAAYLQPQPDAAPFVNIGDRVAAGQTLLIIEAMKTMNAISAPKAGVVRALLVVDGQPVEYGQPLVVIE